jgi:AcrR family transcriptional regulator
MDEEKKKILDICKNKFLKDGFYKITMDEIASSMRMSKKTIYKNFKSKDELVKQLVYQMLDQIHTNVNMILESKNDALTKFKNIIMLLSATIVKMSESWLRDIQNHHLELWKQIDKFRSEKMPIFISQIVKQGKIDKVFYDYPSEIMLTIFIASIRSVVNPQFILQNKFSVKEALETTIDILMNGILTPYGKKLYKKINTENLYEYEN